MLYVGKTEVFAGKTRRLIVRRETFVWASISFQERPARMRVSTSAVLGSFFLGRPFSAGKMTHMKQSWRREPVLDGDMLDMAGARICLCPYAVG